MSVLIPILIVFHVFVCVLMVLVVLMQRPRSEGLGAAFGGGVAENLFGAQTTHVLQKFTVWLGAGFFALTLLLAILYARASAGATRIQKELLSQPAPAAPVVPQETPNSPPQSKALPEQLTTPAQAPDAVSSDKNPMDSQAAPEVSESPTSVSSEPDNANRVEPAGDALQDAASGMGSSPLPANPGVFPTPVPAN